MIQAAENLDRTDRLFMLLNTLFGVLALITLPRTRAGYPGISFAGQLLAAVLLLVSIPAILLLIRLASRRRTGFLDWLSTFYPQTFYIVYFTQVIALGRLLHRGRSFDAPIAALEELLFGFKPVMAVFHSVPKLPLLNELMFFGYFSFYFLLFLPWWLLWFEGRKNEARNSLFVITASFGIFYLWYLLFPVAGPKHFYPELAAVWYEPFEGWLFVPIMKALFTPATTSGAAFPSSHVAVGLISLLLCFRYKRPYFWSLLPLYLLLCASTIYLYTHYVVDIFAGWLAGGGAYLALRQF